MTIHVSISLEASDLSALAALLSGSPALSSLPISVSTLPPAAETAPVAELPAPTIKRARPAKIIYQRNSLTTDELKERTCQVLKEMAVNGVAPTQNHFDHNRPSDMPTMSGILKRLDTSYSRLLSELDLTPSKLAFMENGANSAPFRSVNGGGQ